ncbi:UDP-glucose/GDP-mannose dehydrogenase family protein [Dermabacter sp.]|uniref:UDP-glucose dehydrogenase family protein n=1 Tax=Dermabacter sp. TaxID=37640 RepID=UPI0028FE89A7|nr:UDP-glucose/GDP-mannose dehydrogenase family protein [Dermabacter sp.]MDU1463531.1 UDP-glucose/GDP-mannose dehydrogenase family protein [Dermabacter sp.]
MKISVIGLGYLGAVHAVCMAELGHDVVGIDVDTERIAKLERGEAPFFEPSFPEKLSAALERGNLHFSTDLADVRECDVHFVCVGTPQGSDGSADLAALHAVRKGLREILAGSTRDRILVVGKSTVPVGTARGLSEAFADLPNVELAWNPEFLREGYAVKDTLGPDRLVYGVHEEQKLSITHLDEVYASILEAGTPRLVYGYESAELVKVSANAFLATKISFVNAVAEMCEATGADVVEVAEAIGLDERIGRRFLKAGIGFGGGCLPKDVRAFIASAEEHGVGESFEFLRNVDRINQKRRARPVELALEYFNGDLTGVPITVLGAAFKPYSDDVRDSPAIDIALSLARHGADVRITDPQALAVVRGRYEELTLVDDLEEAMSGARLLILATEWQAYRDLDPARVAELVAERAVIDGRGVFDLVRWREAGFTIMALGRGERAGRLA